MNTVLAFKAMASENVVLTGASIEAQVRGAVEAVLSDTQRMRVVAEAVELNVAQLANDSGPAKIRNTSIILRAQALGLLLEIIRLAGKAERLAAIADIHDAAQ